jgi:hypothetical protein
LKGFGIYYLNDDDQIKVINFDLISDASNNDDKTQDMAAAVRGFRILRKQEFFKRIEKNNFIVWTDCGKHFRNREIMGYFFIELRNIGINGDEMLCFIYSN